MTLGERPQRETVLVTKAKAGHGTAIEVVTNTAAHVTIDIPAGKGGILYAVSLSLFFAPTNAVNAGGAITLRNTAADWDPFYLPTGVWTVATAGGDAIKPFVFACFKKLPGNSTVVIDYIPYNALSQYLEVTLHWIMTEADPVNETFVDIVHPLYATDKVESTNRVQVRTTWAHNANDMIHIPQNKGGTLKAMILQMFGRITTAVVTGGLLEVMCDAHDIEPSEVYSVQSSTLGVTGGGNAYNPMVVPQHSEVKPTSNYIGYYTPRNAAAQSLTWGIVWERPYQRKQ